MEEKSLFSEPPTSIVELKNLLKMCQKPCFSELNKNAFITIMTGFRMILEGFETKNEEINGDIAIHWLRLYLRTHSIVSVSERKLKLYSKTVPIAMTYILGWFQHGPTDDNGFLNEIVLLTLKLVRLANTATLQKLEKNGHGLISILWPIIAKIHTYNLQMYTLELIMLLLKNLNEDFQYFEVSQMVKDEEDDKLKFILLELAKQTEDREKFKKYSRKALNIYNEFRKSNALILSFHCKALYLGEQLKFIKPKYNDYFWFDINLKCKTLTFEGRCCLREEKRYCKVDVNLKILKIVIGSNKIVIHFEAPAEINDLSFEFEDIIHSIDLAYIELNKTEHKRFEKAIKESELCKSVETPYFSFPLRFDNVKKQNDSSKVLTNKQNLTCSSLKVQKVKPWKKTALDIFEDEINAELEAEASKVQTTLQTFDEYDDLEDSDVEPCQSYKNFKTDRPFLFADLSSLRNSETRRERAEVKSDNSASSMPKKRRQTNDTMSLAASTSKSVSNKMKPKQTRSSQKLSFDTIKNKNKPDEMAICRSSLSPVLLAENKCIPSEISTEDDAEILFETTTKTKTDEIATHRSSLSPVLLAENKCTPSEISTDDDAEILFEKISTTKTKPDEIATHRSPLLPVCLGANKCAPSEISTDDDVEIFFDKITTTKTKPDEIATHRSSLSPVFLGENKCTPPEISTEDDVEILFDKIATTANSTNTHEPIQETTNKSASNCHQSTAKVEELVEQQNLLIYCQRSDSESSSDENMNECFEELRPSSKKLLLCKNLSSQNSINAGTSTDAVNIEINHQEQTNQKIEILEISSDAEDDNEAVLQNTLNTTGKSINFALMSKKDNEKTPTKNQTAAIALLNHQQLQTNEETLSSSGNSSLEVLTLLKDLTPIRSQNTTFFTRKRGFNGSPRRLFFEQYDATDSDTSASETLTEIIVIAKTNKRRRHMSMYEDGSVH